MGRLASAHNTTHPPAKAGCATVIMPCLNEVDTISGAVESLVTDPAIETIYVVDGGSIDGTQEQVAKLSRTWPQVSLLHNPKGIIPAAMNVGLHASDTEFVAKVDCHASVSPNYVGVGIKHLNNNPKAVGVGGKRHGISPGAQGQGNAMALSHPFGVGGSRNHYSDTFEESEQASFGVYRRDALLDIGGWDESLLVNEDVDLDHRLTEQGGVLLYDPEMSIYWYNQSSARGLFRQYRRYGRGKAEMIRKNGRAAIRPRHAVPPAFVIGTALTLVASAKFPKLLFVLAPYLTAGALASLQRSLQDAAPELAPRVLVGFLAMHYGWGTGYLESMLFKVRPHQSSNTAKQQIGTVIDLRDAESLKARKTAAS